MTTPRGKVRLEAPRQEKGQPLWNDIKNLGVLDNLGMNYYYLGDYENSKKIYEQLFSIKENPSFADCYFNYGRLLNKLDQKETAKAFFEKALTAEFSVFSSVTKEQVEEELKNLP